MRMCCAINYIQADNRRSIGDDNLPLRISTAASVDGKPAFDDFDRAISIWHDGENLCMVDLLRLGNSYQNFDPHRVWVFVERTIRRQRNSPQRVLQRTHSSGGVVLSSQASTSPRLYGESPPLGLVLRCGARTGAASSGTVGPQQRSGAMRPDRESAHPSECDRSDLSNCGRAAAHDRCSPQHRPPASQPRAKEGPEGSEPADPRASGPAPAARARATG